MSDIGWHFPANNGGSFDGFNDPGIETYAGNPFMSLAREVIQNSLDAAKRSNSKVTVSFEREDISACDLPGRDELRDAFRLCKRQAGKIHNDKAVGFFNRGISALGGGKINCLKVADYNTTGLRGDEDDIGKQWYAIAKARGVSAKESKTAGGSYGIGKHAPFAVSELRTVFYYTKYTENNAVCERAQGKAILMSHEGNNGTTQGVGFYGLRDGCRALNGKDIPKLLARKGEKADDEGTTLLIPGLKEFGDWHDRIIAAVIGNFFYAIDCGNLEVLIDSDDPVLITSESLPELLARQDLQELHGAVKSANCYYCAIKEGVQRDKTLPTLRHSILWTKVGENLPQSDVQSVAIVRNTGMLITDQMQGLRRWVGYDDFAAVCICDSDEGNRLLRDMENPQHDAFQPWRLEGVGERTKGEKALTEMSDWIRREIKKLASIGKSKTDDLEELAEQLPDRDPSETIAGEGDERDIEGNAVWSLKPPKKLKPESLGTIDDPDGEGGEGEQSGGTGGGGSGGGSGGQRKPKTTMKVEGVRILPNSEDGKSKKVMFTPKESGDARLHLSVAGDSFTESLTIKSSDKGEIATGNESVKMRVDAGKRVTLKMELNEPIADSLCIALTKENPNKKEKDK